MDMDGTQVPYIDLKEAECAQGRCCNVIEAGGRCVQKERNQPPMKVISYYKNNVKTYIDSQEQVESKNQRDWGNLYLQMTKTDFKRGTPKIPIMVKVWQHISEQHFHSGI